MKERKFLHRVAAVLCAVVMAVACINTVPYYALEINGNYDELTDYSEFISVSSRVKGIEYDGNSYDYEFDFYVKDGADYSIFLLTRFPFWVGGYECYSAGKVFCYSNDFVYGGDENYIINLDNGDVVYCSYLTMGRHLRSSSVSVENLSICISEESSTYFDPLDCISLGCFDGTFPADESYNASLGYLQNVKENRVYDKVPLGEVVNDKFTARWYFDQFTTTGVDLSSDDYFINYYQERWLVKGYGDDDVIEKSDRYLLASYIIPEGYYIETYSEDIDGVLAGQGYEPPTSFDLLFHKFVVTHHYFQVVDAANNQVGGYLHVYYTDDTGAFGVEYIGETLNDKGEFDEDGYKEVIGEDSITSDDTDAGFEDLEDGTGVDFGDIDGVNDFSGILINYAESVAGFGNALGAFLSAFPPWVLVSVGLAACLLVAGIVFKVLAG